VTVDLQKLDADLKIDEGFESYPYDDKTEKRIVKGDTIEGTATFEARRPPMPCWPASLGRQDCPKPGSGP
jgi:hypothetical protein